MDMFNETNIDPSEFYYVNELDNAQECRQNGGRWIQGLENLKKLNLVPNETIKEYNKKYYRLQESLDNIHASTIQKLTVEFKKICQEKFNRKELQNGETKKTKVLVELPLSSQELDLIENNIVNIITNDIVQIENIIFNWYLLKL